MTAPALSRRRSAASFIASTPRLRLQAGRAATVTALALACASALPGAAVAADAPPANSVRAGDVNGDGHQDFTVRVGDWPYRYVVAYGSPGPGTVSLPGEGGSGFELLLGATPDRGPDSSDSYFPHPSRLGDVDGDGYDDLGVAGNIGRSWVVYGAPGEASVDVGTPGPRVTALVHENRYFTRHAFYGIGDFNGDGTKDWFQSRFSAPTSSTGSLPRIGGGVIVLGGPRVAELETRGSGGRRIQVDTNSRCTTRWVVILPSYTCEWLPLNLTAVGDQDGDGKADLYQPTGSFVIRGRASTATFNGLRRDANTFDVPLQPAGDPWTPTVPQEPEDPTGVGTDGWTLSGVARRLPDGSVNVASKDFVNGAGAVYDASKLVDARELVVDFDVQLTGFDGLTSNGNGLAVAFAAKGEGGAPRAGNPGIGLGWVTNKGIAVALGTVKGGLTPSNNYVGVMNGVVGKSGYPTLLQHAPAVSPLANATNHVTVRSSAGVLTVSINGVERLRRSITLPSDAYLGFTAGVSTWRQDHVVKNVVVKKP